MSLSRPFFKTGVGICMSQDGYNVTATDTLGLVFSHLSLFFLFRGIMWNRGRLKWRRM